MDAPFDPEVQLAELFEALAQQYLNITPGLRTKKDVTDGTDLRVDFVYEGAEPEPFALEVTSIPPSGLLEAHSAGTKWSADLDETVRSERLGRWVVHFDAYSNIREQKDRILEVLRRLPDADTVQDHERRFTLMRHEGAEGDDGIVFLGVSTHAFEVRGFSQELLSAAISNADKLGESRPRQTHLLVHVGGQMSRDPNNTHPPPHPELVPPLASIDWIWVTFHSQRSGSDREWAWWARPGDDEWRTHRGEL